jgi:hypothetical protein
MWAKVLLSSVLLLGSALVNAAELRDVAVERDDDYYRLNSTAWFDASPEALYLVISNYDLFTRFTSAIVESRNVPADDNGRPQFYARMEGCVLLWCKTFIRNGYLLLDPLNEIVAVTDPDRSDFKLSRESWKFVPEGEGTLMIYEFEMVPDFWVPPVIGPFYIMRALRSGGERAIDRIEALARGKEPEQ